MTRLAYRSDLTDDQWKQLEPLIPSAKPGGRPRIVDITEVCNAIFYWLRNGCQWRDLPHDFPKWQSVYTYFRNWSRDGTWQLMNDVLRTRVRERAGRNALPSAGSIDSQSVKTAGAADEKGFDGGKKVKGRKRTILVDTMGLLLSVCVHSAGRSDHAGLTLLAFFCASFWSCLKLIRVDSTFGGQKLLSKIKERYGWASEVVKRSDDQKGFVLLPKRWVVERTYAWLGCFRRLSKDHEYLPTTSEAMIYAAMVHLMLRRLAPAKSDSTTS
ncbi:MAG: IS5 family transposase [Microcystis aeruginosa G11-01]|jgi:putative transposase|uniref:IS5 family transposase n=1 Tax=Microcystis aeruginosa G11-04 TaxID=2685956 RepID=A0A966FZU3_MICAE|nr:IS5 family transposase [Microcystis aeruginosa WS75]NCR26788.1 IS5 family transposase [Microcystis aeruginosa LE13-04]NCR90511.1 IS5 family transposase [Microcystis aeruginosa G13-10]NCS34656.1 IS5 family transposase [Microcystis aeruginosa G11-01]NCS57454.1 IS5 family transposase [Microcystis aeruginosa G11-04]NCT43400.1 IS5 family transposase [Microcystis aeruginosa G11-09]